MCTRVVNKAMFNETEDHYWKRIRQCRGILGSRLLPETRSMDVRVWCCKTYTPFDQRLSGSYVPAAEGCDWGEHYQHAWFEMEAVIPPEWAGSKIIAWIDTNTEALVYDKDGLVLQGVSKGSVFDTESWKASRPFVDLLDACKGNEKIFLAVQAGCVGHPESEVFDKPVPMGPGRNRMYNGRLDKARIAIYDQEIWEVFMDVDVLIRVAEGLQDSSVRKAKILHGLTQACDLLGREPENVTGVALLLQPLLKQPARASDIRVTAVGHAHLDTGWLWPVDVGRQKCARTFANQLHLLDKHDEYIFGASSALHYDWMKQDHPELYARIQQRVKEGRWDIQGGMWVEADCNLPSGESLIRQFLWGKTFFKQEFGTDVDFLWLPDVFGYSASLPQMMKHCGCDVFMSNKLSWSAFNTFPHHSFTWQGIDGSEVLCHFPPEHTYASDLCPKELNKAQERFAERGKLDEMISLFGFGDGGGGPAERHLGRADRCASLEGCPPVTYGRSKDFFDRLRLHADKLDRWVGELYLELHRGTLTTHAFVKMMNRRLEQRLQALEMLWSTLPLEDYPHSSFQEIWGILLVNQFHDIIPGTSVKELYDVAYAEYRKADQECDRLQQTWADTLTTSESSTLTFINTLSSAVDTVVALPESFEGGLQTPEGRGVPVQREEDGCVARIRLNAMQSEKYTLIETPSPSADSIALNGQWILENDRVRYVFDDQGCVVEAFDKQTERLFITEGDAGNLLKLYNDMPAQWEAWDTDIYTENECMETARLVERTPVLEGAVRQIFSQKFTIGDSTIFQKVSLPRESKRLVFENTVDWKETRRLLRVAFDLQVRTNVYTSDIQFGTLTRPTHRNTSREAAMYEVCAHRFVDFSEPDFGVALLNDSKYGHAVHDNHVEMSLLKAPVFPDPTADRGTHDFSYVLLPHANDLAHSDIQKEAAQLNRAPLLIRGSVNHSENLFPLRLSSNCVSLEALKASEDGTCLIVRLVERTGRRVQVPLTFNADCRFTASNGMEDVCGENRKINSGETLDLEFRPFQIRTWRLLFSSAQGA